MIVSELPVIGGRQTKTGQASFCQGSWTATGGSGGGTED